MISFGSMPQRSDDWSWFKPMIISKSIKVQFEEDSAKYTVYGYDGGEVLYCVIWKGAVPGGGDQVQNDLDKTDFEDNYKADANRSVDDVPSKIIAKAIPPVLGGGNSLAVDGSVTPVVFEYNPPTGWDIEINHLTFLFENTAGVAIGNQFVYDNMGTLSNGLLLEVKADDLSVNWQNMKRTRDLIEICDDFDVITGAKSLFRAKVHLPRALRLARDGTFGSPDYIRLTVRDNLSSIDFAEAFFQGVKI